MNEALISKKSSTKLLQHLKSLSLIGLDDMLMKHELIKTSSISMYFWNVDAKHLESFFILLVETLFDETINKFSRKIFRANYSSQWNLQLLRLSLSIQMERKKQTNLAFCLAHPVLTLMYFKSMSADVNWSFGTLPFLGFTFNLQTIFERCHRREEAWALAGLNQASNPLSAELGDLKSFWNSQQKELIYFIQKRVKLSLMNFTLDNNDHEAGRILKAFFRVFVREEFHWEDWTRTYLNKEGEKKFRDIILSFDISSLSEEDFSELMNCVTLVPFLKMRKNLFIEFLNFYIYFVVSTTVFLNRRIDMNEMFGDK